MKTKRTVYLDYAAATPMDQSVLTQMLPYYCDRFYNPSANYLEAKKITKDLNAARASIAYTLGSRPSEIVFTAGGTEANNLAIAGIMQLYPESEVLISAIEHESILEPSKNFNYKIIPVGKDGLVDLVKLEKLISKKTALISIIYANNEIGVVQPIAQISKLITRIKKQRELDKIDLPLYFHTDACQAPGYLDIHVASLGVDLMTLNGGKIYGPKQSGALFVSRRTTIKPQILGGGQEFGVRSGTENVANIIGFSKALASTQLTHKKESKKAKDLQDFFAGEINSKFADAQINGSMRQRLPNNINITFFGKDNETLLMKLDESGIMCAAGSACNARSNNASHVLLAIGLTEDEARSSLRFSWGKQTSRSDISYTIDCLKSALK